MKQFAIFSASISLVFTLSGAKAKSVVRQSLRQSPSVELDAEKAFRESAAEEVAAKNELALVEAKLAMGRWKPPPPKTPWKEMLTERHTKKPGNGYLEGSPLYEKQQKLLEHGNEPNATEDEDVESLPMNNSGNELPKSVEEAFSVSFWRNFRHAHLLALTVYPLVYLFFWLAVGFIYMRFIKNHDQLNFTQQDDPKQAPLEEVLQEARRIFTNLDLKSSGIVSKAEAGVALKSSLRLRELLGQDHNTIFEGLAKDTNKFINWRDLEQWIRASSLGWNARALAREPALGERKAFEFGLFHCSKKAIPICLCSWFCMPIRWAETMSSVPQDGLLGSPSTPRPQFGFHTFWVALILFTVPVALSGLSVGFGLFLFLGLVVYYRQTLRMFYGLESYTCKTCCIDMWLWMLCGCCASFQEAMQVQYAPRPKSSWKGGLASLVPGLVPGVLLVVIVLSFMFF